MIQLIKGSWVYVADGLVGELISMEFSRLGIFHKGFKIFATF